MTRAAQDLARMGVLLVILGIAAAYVWVAGGGRLGGVPNPQSNPSETLIPGSCSKATAARLVGDFFVKWNDHDANGVAGLFSSGVSFHDNVAGKQTMLTGHDALRRYLADRFLLEDRFTNVVADIPEIPSTLRANPTVSFSRSVGTTLYQGNAKLVCVDNLLSDVVMSAG